MSVKGFCRSFAFCGDSFSYKYLFNSQEKNLTMQSKRKMVNIPHIILKLLGMRYCVASINLCPSCNTRSNLMSSHLFCCIKRKIFHQKRTRAYQSHTPFSTLNCRFNLFHFILSLPNSHSCLTQPFLYVLSFSVWSYILLLYRSQSVTFPLIVFASHIYPS